MRLVVLSLFLSACIPSFEAVDCYSELDCPSDFACINGACIDQRADAGEELADAATDAGSDAGSDAGIADAEIADTGEMDATEPDGGPPPDAGTPDGGEKIDAGYSIQVSPALIDFGERPVRCPGPDQLATITNLGVTPVLITNLALAGGTSPAFSIGNVATPFMLNPAASQTVPISFLPQTVGVHNGRLLVSYAMEPIPETSDLTGDATAASTVVDTFTQSAGPIDILVVIEDNTSMLQLQQALATNAIFLMTLLEFDGWDYQIGVTSADVGATAEQGALIGTPPFITPTNVADPQAEFEARVLLGEAGGATNSGLEAMRLALSPPLTTTGANSGFLRANAALLVIHLAKEDDASPMTVAAYAGFLDGLKTAPALSQANAIVPVPFACTLDDGALATMGDRQIQLAMDTGGVVSNACGGDWLDALTTMPAVPLNRTFALGFTPQDPTAIEVRVNGTLVSSAGNWSYDAGQNAVIFSPGSEPQLGASVEITYAAGC